MPDLLDDATGLVAEYDGSSHREASEHTEDNNREETMEGLGLVVARPPRSTSGHGAIARSPGWSRLRPGQSRDHPLMGLAPVAEW